MSLTNKKFAHFWKDPCLAKPQKVQDRPVGKRLSPLSKLAMGLAADWEADILVRNRARETQQITKWISDKAVGIASKMACALNSRTLEIVALWWVSCSDQPRAIPVNHLRAEASNTSQVILSLFCGTRGLIPCV